MSFGTREKCIKCVKTVYPDDRIVVDKRIMHATCFRCAKCKTKLSLANYAELNGTEYCKVHFQEAFRMAGGYKFTDKDKEAQYHTITPTTAEEPAIEVEQPVTTPTQDSGLWAHGRSAITQSMVSTDDMMSTEDQLARLKRQLDKKIITREQYETKVAEIERKAKGISTPVQPKSPRAQPSPRATHTFTRQEPQMVEIGKPSPNAMSPSMKRLMSLGEVELDQPSSQPVQTTTSEDPFEKLKSLYNKGILTQNEYDKLVSEKKRELGIVEPPTTTSHVDVSHIQQRVDAEREKLSGLLTRGIVSQQEFEKLVNVQTLADRGIITQEEMELLVSQKGLEPVQLVRRIEMVQPEPKEENNVEDDIRKMKLEQSANEKRETLERMNAEISQKRSELDQLLSNYEKVQQELGQIEAEISQ
jgi:hypothetical protein